jgi:hypothetical protein
MISRGKSARAWRGGNPYQQQSKQTAASAKKRISGIARNGGGMASLRGGAGEMIIARRRIGITKNKTIISEKPAKKIWRSIEVGGASEISLEENRRRRRAAASIGSKPAAMAANGGNRNHQQ